jgi:hypothetical protein
MDLSIPVWAGVAAIVAVLAVVALALYWFNRREGS